MSGLNLLPAKAGTCVHCATFHGVNDPHNYFSVFYGMRFLMTHSRDATHADCVAHLSDAIKAVYRAVIERRGLPWTEPPGEPVAEPYEKQSGRDGQWPWE